MKEDIFAKFNFFKDKEKQANKEDKSSGANFGFSTIEINPQNDPIKLALL